VSNALALEARGVWKTFRRAQDRRHTPVLKELDLSVGPGEIVGVLAPARAGKTTLLRVLGGLIEPDSGAVRLGPDKPRPGHDVATVFAEPRLLPWRDVLGNVTLGQGAWPDGARAREALARCGAAGLDRRRPASLSPVEAVRVAFARALAAAPGMLLVDDPLDTLDGEERASLAGEIVAILEQCGATVVLATANAEFALAACGRVAALTGRPARLSRFVEAGFARPRDMRSLNASPAFAAAREELRRAGA
jgi:ABC-type nitrate/sulfonate/bicarbonate transport system ATPase subunit